MSVRKTILKPSSSQNQSHTPSTCQCVNCVCVDSKVTGLSRHWFSIKGKQRIIIYWSRQLDVNAPYMQIICRLFDEERRMHLWLWSCVVESFFNLWIVHKYCWTFTPVAIYLPGLSISGCLWLEWKNFSPSCPSWRDGWGVRSLFRDGDYVCRCWLLVLDAIIHKWARLCKLVLFIVYSTRQLVFVVFTPIPTGQGSSQSLQERCFIPSPPISHYVGKTHYLGNTNLAI